MANAKNVRVKPVELNINGKLYTLKYDFNAFIELEEIYGSIDEALAKLQGEVILDKDGKPIIIQDKDGKDIEKRNISFKALRDFLWSGLLYGNENITKKEVAHMLEFSNFSDIADKMIEAIKASLPEKVDDVKN